MSLPPVVDPAADLSVDEVRRYSRHLIIPDVAMDGQKRLKNAKVLVRRRRRSRLSGADVSRRRRRRHARHRRLRRRRRVQPAAPGDPRAERRRPVEGGVGAGERAGDQPARRGRAAHRAAGLEQRDGHLRSRTTSSSTAPTTSPPATSSTTPACCSASPTSGARSTGSTARRACSGPSTGPCYRCLYPEPPPPGMVPSCAEGGVLGVLCAIDRVDPGQRGAQAAHWASASRWSAGCWSTTPWR